METNQQNAQYLAAGLQQLAAEESSASVASDYAQHVRRAFGDALKTMMATAQAAIESAPRGCETVKRDFEFVLACICVEGLDDPLVRAQQARTDASKRTCAARDQLLRLERGLQTCSSPRRASSGRSENYLTARESEST